MSSFKVGLFLNEIIIKLSANNPEMDKNITNDTGTISELLISK